MPKPDPEYAVEVGGERLSPKTYDDTEYQHMLVARQREEDYDRGIEHERDKFLASVSEAKPYLDLVTMITIHAALSGLFFVCLGKLFSSGYSDRLFFGTGLTFILWLYLIGPLNRSLDAIAALLVLRFCRKLGVPYPFRRSRSASLTWLAAAMLAIAEMAVIVGSGYLGYEFAQRTVSAASESVKKETKDASEKKETTPTKTTELKELPPLP